MRTRASRRLFHALPILRLAEQRDADIDAHLELAVAPQRHRRLVGLAVLGIVDAPTLPLAGIAGLGEVPQHLEADDLLPARGLIGILEIDLGLAARLIGLAQPHDAPAEQRAALEDLHMALAALGHPEADRAGTLSQGRARGTEHARDGDEKLSHYGDFP